MVKISILHTFNVNPDIGKRYCGRIAKYALMTASLDRHYSISDNNSLSIGQYRLCNIHFGIFSCLPQKSLVQRKMRQEK